MSLAQVIQQHVDLLSQSQQAQVLDFVLFLEQKKSDAASNKLPLRKPHPMTARVKVVGDIFDSIPTDDWECTIADGLDPNETFDLAKLDALCQK